MLSFPLRFISFTPWVARADHPDVGGADPDALAGVGHQHDVVRITDPQGADDITGLFGHLHGDETFAAASFGRVIIKWRALAETFFGGDQKLGAVFDDSQGDEEVFFARRRIPATPAEGRPIGRMSVSRQRDAITFFWSQGRFRRRAGRHLSHRSVHLPSSILMAMMPSFR